MPFLKSTILYLACSILILNISILQAHSYNSEDKKIKFYSPEPRYASNKNNNIPEATLEKNDRSYSSALEAPRDLRTQLNHSDDELAGKKFKQKINLNMQHKKLSTQNYSGADAPRDLITLTKHSYEKLGNKTDSRENYQNFLREILNTERSSSAIKAALPEDTSVPSNQSDGKFDGEFNILNMNEDLLHKRFNNVTENHNKKTQSTEHNIAIRTRRNANPANNKIVCIHGNHNNKDKCVKKKSSKRYYKLKNQPSDIEYSEQKQQNFARSEFPGMFDSQLPSSGKLMSQSRSPDDEKYGHNSVKSHLKNKKSFETQSRAYAVNEESAANLRKNKYHDSLKKYPLKDMKPNSPKRPIAGNPYSNKYPRPYTKNKKININSYADKKGDQLAKHKIMKNYRKRPKGDSASKTDNIDTMKKVPYKHNKSKYPNNILRNKAILKYQKGNPNMQSKSFGQKAKVAVPLHESDNKFKIMQKNKGGHRKNFGKIGKMKEKRKVIPVRAIERSASINSITKRKVGLHRNFPPKVNEVPNVRKRRLLGEKARSARSDKSNILHEIKDLIVKHFADRKERGISKIAHGSHKTNRGIRNTGNRKSANRPEDAVDFSNISSADEAPNSNAGILEEIKDFVVSNFHPQKVKRNISNSRQFRSDRGTTTHASNVETDDDFSEVVQRETPSFDFENVTSSEYDDEFTEKNPKREVGMHTGAEESVAEEQRTPTELTSEIYTVYKYATDITTDDVFDSETSETDAGNAGAHTTAALLNSNSLKNKRKLNDNLEDSEMPTSDVDAENSYDATENNNYDGSTEMAADDTATTEKYDELSDTLDSDSVSSLDTNNAEIFASVFPNTVSNSKHRDIYKNEPFSSNFSLDSSVTGSSNDSSTVFEITSTVSADDYISDDSGPISPRSILNESPFNLSGDASTPAYENSSLLSTQFSELSTGKKDAHFQVRSMYSSSTSMTSITDLSNSSALFESENGTGSQNKSVVSRSTDDVENEKDYDYQSPSEAAAYSKALIKQINVDKNEKKKALASQKNPNSLKSHKKNDNNIDINVRVDDGSQSDKKKSSGSTGKGEFADRGNDIPKKQGKNQMQEEIEYEDEHADFNKRKLVRNTKAAYRKKHIYEKLIHNEKPNSLKKIHRHNDDRKEKIDVTITRSLENEQFKNEQHDDYELSTEADYSDSSTVGITKNKARDSGGVTQISDDEPNYSDSSIENTRNRIYHKNLRQNNVRKTEKHAKTDIENREANPSNTAVRHFEKHRSEMKEREDVFLNNEDDTELSIIDSATTEESLSSIADVATQLSETDSMQSEERVSESDTNSMQNEGSNSERETDSMQNEEGNSERETPDDELQEDILPGSSMHTLDRHEVKRVNQNQKGLDHSYTSNKVPIAEAAFIGDNNEGLSVSENKPFKNWKINAGDLKKKNVVQSGNGLDGVDKLQKDEQNEYDYESIVDPTEAEDETETVGHGSNTGNQVFGEMLGEQGNNFKKSVAVKRNDTKGLPKPVKQFAQVAENGIRGEDLDTEYEDSTKSNDFENDYDDEEDENEVSTESDTDYGDLVHDEKKNNLKNLKNVSKTKKQALSDSVKNTVERFTNNNEDQQKQDEEAETEYDYENTRELESAKQDNFKDINRDIKNREQNNSPKGLFVTKNGNPEHQSILRKTAISTSSVLEDVSEASLQESETEENSYNFGTNSESEDDNRLDSATSDNSATLNFGRKYRTVKGDNISIKYSKDIKESKLPNNKTVFLSRMDTENTTVLSVMTSSTSEVAANAHDNTSSIDNKYARRAYGGNGNAPNLDENQTENKANAKPKDAPSNPKKYKNVVSQESVSDDSSLTYSATLQNLKIMPDDTTAYRVTEFSSTELTTESSSTELTTEEPAVKRDDDYQADLNSENEEYYDEVANSNQNINKIPKSIEENTKMVLPPNKRTLSANEEDESDNRLDESLNDRETNNIHSVSDEEENAIAPDKENTDEEENDSELQSDADSSYKSQNSNSFKTRRSDDKLKEYLKRIARHSDEKRQAMYDSMPRIKSRKTRDVANVEPTPLVRHPQPSSQLHKTEKAWTLGIVGLLTVASITVGIYYIIPKRSTTKVKCSDTPLAEYQKCCSIPDGCSGVDIYTSDFETNDKWSDDEKRINGFVNEVLQKLENSEDGDVRDEYSTARHLSKIYAAVTGTLE